MRIKAIIVRIAQQFWHDKRTLALMLLAPILILWLLSLVFNGDTYEPRIAVINAPDSFVQALETKGAKVSHLSETEAALKLNDYEIDAIVNLNAESAVVQLEGSDPAVSQSVLLLLRQVFDQNRPNTAQALQVTTLYLHGSADMASFDNFGPVLIGFFIFFFVFIIAGISFLRERSGGTLERLMASPLKHYEIVLGYICGFGIFTVLQSVLVTWFATQILDIQMVGSFWYLLLITTLLAMTALTLGTLISTFASNEFQMIQFIPIVVVPQIFFSGLFNLETMSSFLRSIGMITPLRYGADALRDIMIRGKGWGDIWLDALILAGFSILFMLLNLLALRKHRKI